MLDKRGDKMSFVRKRDGLDAVDRKILEELQNNGRISYRGLGKRIGLSAPSVIERIRKMESEEVIQGYVARVDQTKIGYPIRALAYMSTSFNNPDPHISRKIDAIPEVLRQWSITGENDYCIEIIARSVVDLGRILSELAKLGKLSTSVALSWQEKWCIPSDATTSES